MTFSHILWRAAKASLGSCCNAVDIKCTLSLPPTSWNKQADIFQTFLSLGIRIFSSAQRSTDVTQANALSFKRNIIDVYSNSWGPGDSGFQVKGPGPRLNEELEKGTRLVCILLRHNTIQLTIRRTRLGEDPKFFFIMGGFIIFYPVPLRQCRKCIT